MSDRKKASDEVASKASQVLRDGRTADDSKSAAGSALSQAGKGTTSDEAASKASDVLRDEDHGANSKSSAGSTLSQKKD